MKSRLFSAFQSLCGAAAAGYSVIALGRATSDAHVVLAAAAIFLIGLIGEKVAKLTLPLYAILVAAEIAVADEGARLLVAGIALAVAVTLLLVRALDRSWRLPRREALLVGSVLAASFSLLPLTAAGAGYAVLMITAVVLLVYAGCDEEAIALPAFASSLLVVFVTPHEPLRALIFPFVVAATVAALRRSSRAAAVVAVLLALAAGKWALPIAAIGLLAFVRTKESTRPMMVLPAVTALADLSRFAMLAPAFVRALVRVRPVIALSALLLVAVAAVSGRPQLTTLFVVVAMYVVTAASTVGTRSARPVLLADHGDVLPEGAGRALRVPTDGIDGRDGQLMLVVLAICVVPFAWSGAVARTFPLPVAVSVSLVLAILIATLSFRRLPPLLTASIAAAALVFLGMSSRPLVSDGSSHEAISGGQSVSTPMPRPAERVVVAISGANLTGLDPSAPLGRIEWVTHEGRGYSRDVFVREVADWGAFRAGASFRSENSLPRNPAGMFHGRGRDSWLRGTGAIALEGRAIELVRVIADEQLQAPAALIVERIDPVDE